MNYEEFFEMNRDKEIYFKRDSNVEKIVDFINIKDIRDTSRVPKNLFENTFEKINTEDCNPLTDYAEDFSPVYIKYEDRASEYGFKLITLFMTNISNVIIVRVEYQYKGQIIIQYFKE